MKNIIILLSLLNFSHAFSEENKKTYQYKQFEVIDLGAMEIKGQIMAPGDLTITERKQTVFRRDLLEKVNFDYENRREIENLR